jgi:hypothetical protein
MTCWGEALAGRGHDAAVGLPTGVGASEVTTTVGRGRTSERSADREAGDENKGHEGTWMLDHDCGLLQRRHHSSRRSGKRLHNVLWPHEDR